MVRSRRQSTSRRATYTPRWTRPARGPDPGRRPTPAAEVDAEIQAFAEGFVAAEADPRLSADALAERIRHLFLCAHDTQQRFVVVARKEPPYFGVTTEPAAVDVEEV